MEIREDFLYYIWSFKLFDFGDLTTTDGDPLSIMQFGYRNEHSGPDFHQAKIVVGHRTWIGHVEMHLKSSDWLAHQHNQDPAFQNVILHVVYEHDTEITLPNGEPLPCLELKDRIAPKTLTNYQQLLQSKSWIPCARNEKKMKELAWHSWYERILIERISKKTTRIDEQLVKTENDWEEVFYRQLARNFGFKVNDDVFENLAKSLPYKLLIKHGDRLRDIEALLFGQAGMLSPDLQDEYGKSLREIYIFLSKKYQLTALEPHLWKFMRLRPANFPTIRLAQFAVLLFKSSHLFSKTLAARNYRELKHLFSSDVSAYWRTHYRFSKESTKKSKKLGSESIRLIVINTVVPFLFIYGQKQNEKKYISKSLRFLEELKPERNKITKGFLALDFPCENAFDSQALLQLKHSYCDRKRCLSCAVGMSVLRSGNES